VSKNNKKGAKLKQNSMKPWKKNDSRISPGTSN
jgi:hypothetical protein